MVIVMLDKKAVGRAIGMMMGPLGINDTEMARRIDVKSGNTIKNWRDGNTSPSIVELEKIAVECKHDLLYALDLVYGGELTKYKILAEERKKELDDLKSGMCKTLEALANDLNKPVNYDSGIEKKNRSPLAKQS
jgi:transcriptional regulator with XRE-family HTH domain